MLRRDAIGALGSLGMVGSAWSAEPPTSATEVVLGQSAIISGPLGGPIKAMTAGAQLAFDAVNAQGGLHGRKIRLITLDDELAPPKAVANYKKLLDEQGVVDRVLSISCIAASPADVRGDVERRVRAVAAGATELPYMTELYLGLGIS